MRFPFCLCVLVLTLSVVSELENAYWRVRAVFGDLRSRINSCVFDSNMIPICRACMRVTQSVCHWWIQWVWDQRNKSPCTLTSEPWTRGGGEEKKLSILSWVMDGDGKILRFPEKSCNHSWPFHCCRFSLVYMHQKRWVVIGLDPHPSPRSLPSHPPPHHQRSAPLLFSRSRNNILEGCQKQHVFAGWRMLSDALEISFSIRRWKPVASAWCLSPCLLRCMKPCWMSLKHSNVFSSIIFEGSEYRALTPKSDCPDCRFWWQVKTVHGCPKKEHADISHTAGDHW